MTRETKIGLLVGLAFIIVVGILLSDYLRSTGEPPQAALANAASAVRDAINSPGTNNPPITIVAPHDAPPQQQVPTRDELNPAPSPVIPMERTPAQQETDANPLQAQPDQTVTSTPTAPTNDSLTAHPLETTIPTPPRPRLVRCTLTSRKAAIRFPAWRRD
jgi:hypothetical protein